MNAKPRWMITLTMSLALSAAGCERTGILEPAPAAALDTDELSTLLSGATEEGPVAETVTSDDETETAAGGEDRNTRHRGKTVFDQLAEKIPEFGGLYRIRPCHAGLVLTDLTNADNAIRQVKEVIGPLVKQSCPDGIRLEAVEGKYTYTKLVRFRHALRPLQQVRGVRGAKIDFAQNKVIVGIASRAVIESVRQAIARLDIPPDAIGVHVQQHRRG